MLLFGIPKSPEAAQGESSPPIPIPSAPLALEAQGPRTEFLGPKPAEAWPVPGAEWPSLLPTALLSCPLGSPMKISVCLTPTMEALTWLSCAPVVSQSLGLIASFLVPSPSGALHPADPSHLVHSRPLLETCQPLTSSTGLWVPPLWDKRHRALEEESRSQGASLGLLPSCGPFRPWSHPLGYRIPSSSLFLGQLGRKQDGPYSFTECVCMFEWHVCVRVSQQACGCVREGMELLNMRSCSGCPALSAKGTTWGLGALAYREKCKWSLRAHPHTPTPGKPNLPSTLGWSMAWSVKRDCPWEGQGPGPRPQPCVPPLLRP